MKEDTHVIEFLPEYALNCLEAEETVMVAEHLAVCRQCRRVLHPQGRDPIYGEPGESQAGGDDAGPGLRHRWISHLYH